MMNSDEKGPGSQYGPQNPYQLGMVTDEMKYAKKMFAFLDILGFETLVNQSKDNPELVGKIVNILKQSKEIALRILKAKLTVLRVDPTQYLYRAFSDTVVICGPYVSHDDFNFLSTWIANYQYFMWKEEQYFVRGAVVYGDIYHDEDFIFGPAFVEGYHLERDEFKAVWPRVLIDESVLNQLTQTERTRDFLEILRRDGNDLVYLDYLREFFHLFAFAENQKVLGARERDYGMPTELFKNHKQAILGQVNELLKKENNGDSKAVISKYLELSRYHNDTIDALCTVITEIQNDDNLIPELFEDLIKSALFRQKGIKYEPKFSAEEHPEQSDMLTVLGTAVSRVIADHLMDNNNNSIEEAVATIGASAPDKLQELRQSLDKARIDLDGLGK